MISDELRNYCLKYIGEDGKLIIDDSLPEDVKEAFQFFNDENINILELNSESLKREQYNVVDTHPDDPDDDEDDNDNDITTSTSTGSLNSEVIPTNVVMNEEIDENEVSDLEDLF